MGTVEEFSDGAAGTEPARGIADMVLDEVLPDDFDWERMVTTYPAPSLAVAVAAGFFVGYRHGAEILEAASNFFSGRVEKTVDGILSD